VLAAEAGVDDAGHARRQAYPKRGRVEGFSSTPSLRKMRRFMALSYDRIPANRRPRHGLCIIMARSIQEPP